MSDTLSLSPSEVRALDFCTYCPRLCHFACPVAHGDASETATAWGMMSLANLMRRGMIAPTPEDVEHLYRCVSCGRCTAFCRHENDVAGVLQTAREQLARTGLEPSAVVELRDQYHLHGAPEPLDTSLDRTLRGLRAGSGHAYWPSCHDAGEGAPSIERRLSLLSAVAGARVELGWRTGASCCGGAAERAGLRREADAAKTAMATALAGFHTVITDCVDLDLPKGGPRVVPVVEFLAAHRDALERLSCDAAPERVTLHGGCRERRTLDLGRFEWTVLEAVGCDVVDAFAIEGVQECCAADRVYRAIAPNGAARAAASVVAGARREPTRLLTSASRCAAHMSEASGEPVASVLDYVLERCSIPG